jgi:hypothetical protein
MIDPANYDKPQPLSQLMRDRLSRDEWARLSKARKYCKRVTPSHSDWWSGEHLTAFKDWASLQRTMISGVKCFLEKGALLVCGWPHNKRARGIDRTGIPTFLRPEAVGQGLASMLSSIPDSELPVEGCDWDLPLDDLWIDDDWYLSCMVVQRSSLLTTSYGAPKTRSAGRPMNPKIETAAREAQELVDKGQSPEDAAATVAEKYGVSVNTIRRYLTPSGKPKSLK